jgi:hypothetical protein
MVSAGESATAVSGVLESATLESVPDESAAASMPGETPLEELPAEPEELPEEVLAPEEEVLPDEEAAPDEEEEEVLLPAVDPLDEEPLEEGLASPVEPPKPSNDVMSEHAAQEAISAQARRPRNRSGAGTKPEIVSRCHWPLVCSCAYGGGEGG